MILRLDRWNDRKSLIGYIPTGDIRSSIEGGRALIRDTLTEFPQLVFGKFDMPCYREAKI